MEVRLTFEIDRSKVFDIECPAETFLDSSDLFIQLAKEFMDIEEAKDVE